MDKKIVFAGDDRMQAVAHLWPRFCREVLQLDPDDVLVTDESYLTDFCEFGTDALARQQEVDNMHRRFYLEYLVDGGHTRVIVELLELVSRQA